jgi:ketosteroid isomerase-like protein
MTDIARQIFYGLLVELFSLIVAYLAKENKKVAIAIFIVGTTSAGIVAFSPIFTNQTETVPTLENCPYASSTDNQTFINLIYAEEEAVLSKNINPIKEIYASNAVFLDVSTNTTDADVIKRYEEGFVGFTFLELEHFNFDILKKTSNTAWVAVSDRSKIRDLSSGTVNTYTGTAHIIFRKDSLGCWRISEFHGNAEGEVFP